MTGNTRRWIEVGLLGLAAICFVLLARCHWQQIGDDAFIAFRYADHVVAGLGPVWNAGERVEGFSSPLWLGLLVAGRALGADLPAWAGAFGIAFAGLSLLAAHRLALALSSNRIAAAAACLATALVYPLYYWASAGLETTLFTLLVTAAAWSMVTASTSTWPWALVAAFLGLARPEGPFLVVALTVLAGLVHGGKALRPRRLLLALGPTLAWLVFRRLYFGAWLPNTYDAKATGDFARRLSAGLLYAPWAIVALAAASVVVAFAWGKRRATLAALALPGCALTMVLVAGGDWMWHGRMLLPVLPGLLALCAAGIAVVPASRRPALVLACALAWSGFLPSPTVLALALSGQHLPATEYQEGTMVPAALEAANFIAENYPAEALIAVNHAGALPYSLPNPCLDMTGLGDRHIARDVAGGLHHKFDAAYVLGRKPRLFVLNSRVRPGTRGIWYHAGYWIGETALVTHPDFQARYRAVPIYWEWKWSHGMGGFILLYERIGD